MAFSPPSHLSPGDRGVARRQAKFMSRVLARPQRCHPDTCASCRPSLPGPYLSQERSRYLWDRCRDPRGQGHTSQ